MTNKEAAERIKHLIALLKSPRMIMPYCKEELQALDLAIKALEEQERPTGEWIPVTYRPMTEEEVKEACEEWGIKEEILEDWDKRVFTCSLPDDGQEILVSRGKYVQEDICEWDEYSCGLENNGDWSGITAWMPCPKPYKEAENERS